jgi:hypothetical protein
VKLAQNSGQPQANLSFGGRPGAAQGMHTGGRARREQTLDALGLTDAAEGGGGAWGPRGPSVKWVHTEFML